MKKSLLICGLLFLSYSNWAQIDGDIDDPGDILFVAYNEDGVQNDGFAFLVMDDIPNGLSIIFSDDEYDNTNMEFPMPFGEGDITWTNDTGASVEKGTVIIVENANDHPSSPISVNIGFAEETEAPFNLAAQEQIYAFTGSRAAPTFLSMIASGGGDANGDIPASLTSGSTALILTSTASPLIYNGSTTCNGTLTECQNQLYTTTSWSTGTEAFPGDVPASFDGSLLPVELMSFSARITKEESTRLNWSTATETNNHYFLLEKSRDGKTFEEIAQIAGAGTSTNAHDYQYTDHTPFGGITYYRLSQTDFDGRRTYFDVLNVHVAKPSNYFRLLPNPVSDMLQIDLDQPIATDLPVLIWNSRGQMVHQTAVFSDTKHLDIDLSHLSSGTYFIQLAGQADAAIQQFIKQ